MNGENNNGRSEFIGYMRRAIEDIGMAQGKLEERIIRLEDKVNGLTVKIAIITASLGGIWILIREYGHKIIMDLFK